MFNEIPNFLNFISSNNYNYPFVSTILHKLSNLKILNMNDIDIHDNYLYNKHFKYEISKEEKLSNNFIKIYDYFNSLNLLLIPPNYNTKKLFKNHNDNFYNTKIFLSLYRCFIESPDIFNFDTTSLKTQSSASTASIDKEFVKIIDEKLLSAKTEFEYYQDYKKYLNIYSVQYYYIAKSIVDFCSKYSISDNNNIIDFCNFIHKFFLFNKLFNCLLKQKLYNDYSFDINKYLHKDVGFYDIKYEHIFIYYINNTTSKNVKSNIINILNKLIDRKILQSLFNQHKFINDDEFKNIDIDFFNSFYNKLFKNNLTTYLDGFTINFNFPPPSFDNTNKLKLMRYPEKQLTSITQFLYEYPKYLYHDFNNNYIFNINYFVETNIIEILGNDIYKKKLDKYYRHLLFDAVKKNKLDNEIYYFGKKILLLNNYRFESNTYDFRRNSNSREKEKDLIYELLIKNTSKTYSDFENLTLETDDIETKITKYNLNIKELQMINCLEEFKLLFNTDNADVFLIANKIYIFYENYYLVINIETFEDNEIQIVSIYINGIYKVIKREDITDHNLFIYFIPSACLSLIYKIDDQYNVLCIASEFNDDECGVLIKKNEITNKYKIFNYSIDSSNLLNLSFDKDPKQIDKLNYFIQNYGVNNLNYIYLKDWNNKGVQEINNNDFNLLSSFNSEYVNTNYNLYYKEENTKIKNILSKTVTTDEQKYINYSLIKEINDITKMSFAIKPLDKEDSKL